MVKLLIGTTVFIACMTPLVSRAASREMVVDLSIRNEITDTVDGLESFGLQSVHIVSAVWDVNLSIEVGSRKFFAPVITSAGHQPLSIDAAVVREVEVHNFAIVSFF